MSDVQIPAWGTRVNQLPVATAESAPGLAGFIDASGNLVPLDTLAQLLGASTGATPAEVIAVGAQGIVFSVGINSAGAYTYTSTQDGPSLPFVSRSDLSLSGQLLNSTGIIRVILAYGQSWQTIDPAKATSLSNAQTGYEAAIAAGNQALAAAWQEEINFLNAAIAMSDVTAVFKFANNSRQPVAQIGSPTGYTSAVDFLGCNANTAGNPFGTMFALCLQAFARRDLLQVQPIVTVCASYPGTGLASLISPSNPLYVPAASGEQAWLAQVQMIALVNAFAAKYGLTPKYEMCLLVEGCGTGAAGSFTPLLEALMSDYDSLNLNGDGSTIQLWLNPTPANTEVSQEYPASEDQLNIVNVLSGRAWNFGPWYDGTLNDYIHWDFKTVAQNAERGALCKHLVDQGVGFNNAPRMSGIYIVANGDGVTATLTIDISEPIPNQFISAVVDPLLTSCGLDPQWGFKAKKSGNFVTISSMNLTGSRITAQLSAIPAVGDEVSYAWYGTTSVAGTHSGVFGNIKKPIGTSVILPSQTVDLFLQAEAITLTSSNFAAPPAVPAITGVSLSNTTAQANQTAATNVGVISSTTTGSVGVITYSLADTGGNFTLYTDGVTVQAIAGLPAGTFPLTVIATSSTGLTLSQPFSIVSS